MPDKIVNHFVLADGSTAKYDYDSLINKMFQSFSDPSSEVAGYVTSNGTIGEQGSYTQEITTDFIPVLPSDSFRYELTYSTTRQGWICVGRYDENKTFIDRVTLVPETGGASFDGVYTVSPVAPFTVNASIKTTKYIRFSYRSYGETRLHLEGNKSLQNMYKTEREYETKNLFCFANSVAGYIDTTGGQITSPTNRNERTSEFIPAQAGKTYSVKAWQNTDDSSQSIWIGVCFYDSEKNPLRPRQDILLTFCSIVAPDNTAYIRVSARFYDNVFLMVNEGVKPATIYKPNGKDEYLSNYTGAKLTLILGGKGYPSLDTANRTFTMPEDCVLEDGGNFYISAQSVTLALPTATSAICVYYNKQTGQYDAVMYNTRKDANWLLICSIRINTSGYPTTVSMTCPYSIDGKLYGIDVGVDVYDDIAWAFNENVKGVNHRGYYTAPENTLPAYKLSKQVGFKYCECDVSMTSDRVPVLLHDETINRTARNEDGTAISETINIGSITYEQALQYDFGIYKGSQYAGTKIPTFEQFITLCRNLGLHPYIELKGASNYTEAEVQNLVDIVKQNGMEGKVTWISFSQFLLGYVKNYDASARLGFVLSTLTSQWIETASSLKTSTNEVFLDVASISDDLVDDCITAGLPVEVWTINSTSGITALNDYISGVTSDNLIASKVLYEANI